MELNFLACADSISVDKTTNTLSIFNILEEASAPVFPALVPRVAIIALFSRKISEPNDVEATLELVTIKSKKKLLSTPLPIAFQSLLRTRVIAQLYGLTIEAPDVYRFNVVIKGKIVGYWDMVSQQVGQPQMTILSSQPEATNKQKKTVHRKASGKKVIASKKRK